MSAKAFVAEVGRAAKMPEFEKRFLQLWQALDGGRITAEHKFHPARKWRLDYAHVESKTAVELHGSVWTQGRHTRGGGFIADREKMIEAQKLGWIVFELAPEMVTRERVQEIIDTIRKRKA
jgi:hypothetical protein